MVWDARKITQRTWPEVVAFYRNLEDRNPDFQPLRELAEHVTAQPYASSIGAATSGTAVLVLPVTGFERGDAPVDALRLDVDLGGSARLVAPSSLRRATDPPTGVDHPALIKGFEGLLRKAGWVR
jgi:hypothetical protein